MSRVLFLAYYYPPLGGAGVQRTVKFLKHLPSLGYSAVVVTGSATTVLDWAPPDVTLESEVPETIEVHRLALPQPQAAADRTQKLRRWLDRPSAFQQWWTDGIVETVRRDVGEIDIVYASMSPFETALAAGRVASERQVPWVADLRDPWALDEWTIYPTAVHRRRDEARMRRLLQTANAIILNTAEARRVVAERFPELADRLTVIPNGWDASDFASPPPSRDDHAFRVVYAGYSHAESGMQHRRKRSIRALLGGTTPGLDVLARSDFFLRQAVANVLTRSRSPERSIELHVAGAAPPGELPSYMRHHGYLPHREAISLMRSADLLFLPMQDLPRGMRTRTVPGKLYEYLASGRPILAALPEGDGRDLLTGLPGVRTCLPTDVACFEAALLFWLRRPPEAQWDLQVAAPFERQRLAERLVQVLDEAIGGSRVPRGGSHGEQSLTAEW